MCAFNLRFLAIQPAKTTEYSETLGGPASGCSNQPQADVCLYLLSTDAKFGQ